MKPKRTKTLTEPRGCNVTMWYVDGSLSTIQVSDREKTLVTGSCNGFKRISTPEMPLADMQSGKDPKHMTHLQKISMLCTLLHVFGIKQI